MKPGDEITMKPGAMSLFGHDVGGLTGTFTHHDSRPERGHSLSVGFPGVEGSKLVSPEDVLTVNNTYTDAQIDAALARVKYDNGYCSEFDRAVEEAKNMPLLDKLDWVASERNRPEIFQQLVEVLKENDAHKFSEGDRVHYTTDRGEFVLAFIEGEWVFEYNTWDQHSIGEPLASRDPFPHPDRKIITTVNLAPGREYTVPKIVEIDGYFVVRDGYAVKVYTDKAAAEAYKSWGGLVHVTSVENGYEQIARYAQRDSTYQQYIPAVLAAIKFISAEGEGK